MKNQAHFVFLGTGGSMGIPVIGCGCPVCTSESSYNKRLRPSGLITIDGKKFLLDCGPDFRLQALRSHIDHLDGLLITHTHHDHIAGIDELRVYYMHSKKTLPCLMSKATLLDLKQRYPYVFDIENIQAKLTPRLDLHLLENDFGSVLFQDIPIRYATYEQAGMKVNGFRIGNLAYCSDLKTYTDEIFESLKGVDTLILSALRFDTSYFHLSIDEAIAFSRKVNARQTWLTHIAHDLDHTRTNEYLPPNIRMAYDGLEIVFEVIP